MKRHLRRKRGVVAVLVMITHAFSLFSAEGQGFCIAVSKQETLVTVPGITGRVVMVPEKIWQEHYEERKKTIISTTKQSSSAAFKAWVLTLDPLCPENSRVNLLDDEGFAPIHYLVQSEDATPRYVKILQSLEADITLRSKVRDSQGVVRMRDAYRTGIKNTNRSPEGEPIGSFFEGQCYGNKDTMQYVFIEILLKKLESVKKQKSLIQIPWITERTVMVPEEIWKEHYERLQARKNEYALATEIVISAGGSSVGEYEYFSNKDEMQYISMELPRRLSWVIEQRKTQEEIMRLMRQADWVLIQEIRKSLGLPTFESLSPCRKNHG